MVLSREIHSTKKKIFSIARKMAIENEFENITIRDICKEANISVGAFYHHFSSKEEMINESFLIYDTDLYLRLNEYDEKNPINSLKLLLLDQISFVSSFPFKLVVEYYRSMLSSSSKGGLDSDRPYYKAVSHFVGLSLEENKFSSDYTKEYLADYFIRYIRGNLIHWCLQPDRIDIVNQTSRELDQLIKMFSIKNQ